MASNRYVALLRGINVGGRNIISMADLRGAFEAAGYGAVRTYIQSGNVLFESDSPSGALEDDLERVLERRGLARGAPAERVRHVLVGELEQIATEVVARR